jgi:hypothetical protein
MRVLFLVGLNQFIAFIIDEIDLYTKGNLLIKQVLILRLILSSMKGLKTSSFWQKNQDVING